MSSTSLGSAGSGGGGRGGGGSGSGSHGGGGGGGGSHGGTSGRGVNSESFEKGRVILKKGSFIVIEDETETKILEETDDATESNKKPISRSEALLCCVREFFGTPDATYVSEGTGTRAWLAPISPSSRFTQVWNFVSGLLVVHADLIKGFADFPEALHLRGHAAPHRLLLRERIVDVFFVLEVLIHGLTGADVHGEIVHELSISLRVWARHELAVDFLASVPMAWIEFFAVPNVSCEELSSSSHRKVYRYLRTMRMIRLLRLFKVLKIFDVLRDILRVRPAMIRLLKTGFIVFYGAHLGGCFFWLIKLDNASPDALQEFRDHNNFATPIWSPYLTSVYFMMATLTTVGYGDIGATNDNERLYVIFMMLLGASFFAILISNMSVLAANLMTREKVAQETMETLIDFMREHGISRKLEHRVQSFFHFKTRQIKLALNRKMLGCIHIFDKLSDSFMGLAMSRLELVLKLPKEAIFNAGEEANEMFIVVSGEVAELTPNFISTRQVFDTYLKAVEGAIVWGSFLRLFVDKVKWRTKYDGVIELDGHRWALVNLEAPIHKWTRLVKMLLVSVKKSQVAVLTERLQGFVLARSMSHPTQEPVGTDASIGFFIGSSGDSSSGAEDQQQTNGRKDSLASEIEEEDFHNLLAPCTHLGGVGGRGMSWTEVQRWMGEAAAEEVLERTTDLEDTICELGEEKLELVRLHARMELQVQLLQRSAKKLKAVFNARPEKMEEESENTAPSSSDKTLQAYLTSDDRKNGDLISYI
ncbi:hypothetical protein GUITHDRAFT_140682 [Guillardia theta CCMP2712]|uniref:Cyclic nucleotide-binding domain-containing protein n=1 Tax=Guillardia theta (strain CCMP2712) TaxID=905079 RepID=L1J4N9_GUITC|nr:hypothetical protein GUITHDRAFT_140682 [Guillardia theta CCMP2712]EKX43094.1 hypothetical protein GUITHDRAFT_140682 [Guillardia theta CCMP2712]|eukprot:XP_005830074.1 hypothetical protein GUITHDRAFT_140682 [Guillardia theta CCMP2712]